MNEAGKVPVIRRKHRWKYVFICVRKVNQTNLVNAVDPVNLSTVNTRNIIIRGEVYWILAQGI